MLRHLHPSEFQTVMVIGVFVLTLAVFLFFFIRALRLNKDQAEHLSRLPLQDEPEPHSQHE